jgi:hypothetical protein
MAKELVSFPNHYVNPKEKGDAWITQMSEAIFDEWGSNSIKSFAKGANRYALNKLYSLGKNPNDAYKPIFELSEDENSSYINLDLSPLPVIPKFKRIVLNRFAKIPFFVEVQAIDEFAMDEKSSYEAEERANIKIRQMLAELGVDSSVIDSGEVDQPKDEEELAIKMDYGYKHNQAIDIEKRIDAVFTHEKIMEKMETVRDQGFDTGVYALKVDTESDTGKVTVRNVDPSQLVVSPTKDPHFRDIWYAGETIFMTIDEIRRAMNASGSEISEQSLEELAHKNAGINGNPKYFSGNSIGGYKYDSCKVAVFDCEFLSCNRYWYEKRKDKRGNPVIGKVSGPEEKKDRDYYKDDRIVCFKVKRVVGTKIIFEYGLKSDMPRKVSSEWDTKLSYKIVAPEMNNMETSPIVENIIPIADQVCIANIKLQNVIAKARPRGIMIEIGALDNISLGDAGEGAMKAIDVIDMYSQTGILVYRKMDLDGSMSNYKPIEELDNGLGTEAQEYFGIIDRYMQKIREMIGFNDVTDGSTPDPKTLNGVAAMSTEATNNALHHLLAAEQSLIEEVAEEVAIRVHDSIAFKKNSPYRNVFAPSVIKSIDEDKNQIHRDYSTAIKYGSDQFEKEKLSRRIEIAQANKEITLSDALSVEQCRNNKEAEQRLAYRIKKNTERTQQLQERLVQQNAQASADAARVAEEEKRKTKQMEVAAEAELEKLKHELAKDLMVLEYTLKNNLVEQPNRDLKKEVANTQAEATKEVAKIKKQLPTTVAI